MFCFKLYIYLSLDHGRCCAMCSFLTFLFVFKLFFALLIGLWVQKGSIVRNFLIFLVHFSVFIIRFVKNLRSWVFSWWKHTYLCNNHEQSEICENLARRHIKMVTSQSENFPAMVFLSFDAPLIIGSQEVLTPHHFHMCPEFGDVSQSFTLWQSFLSDLYLWSCA